MIKMDMPSVHKCSQLISENEQLKKKLRKMKQQNIALQRELNDIKDSQRMEAMLKDFVTTRNMETQTDPPKSLNVCTQPQHKKLEAEPEKVNRLIGMHNSLMRKYEKELKTNMQHVETITTLNLKINELEQKLRETEIKNLDRNIRSAQDVGTASTSENFTDVNKLRHQIKQIKKERDKIAVEKQRLVVELKGLDEGFFEEIEDLKFALQQSAKLNKAYESSLQKMCIRFGVPFPHPEKRL